MELGSFDGMCAAVAAEYYYTGVVFIIALRTRCSPTMTPCDLNNTVSVRLPYEGPT